MKIIILGAGASYDCINRFHDEEGYHEAHNWRPPLGNDIFGSRENFRDIYDKYPGAASLSHSINSGNDIEEFFQNKWELAVDSEDKHTLANIINTQYCLQELFYEISLQYSENIGVGNYHVLIQQAHDYHIKTGENVVFITFNYDLLLEIALIQYYNEEDKIEYETYTKYPLKIFKPHGSCNWFRPSYKYSKQELIKNKPSFDEIQNHLEKELIVSGKPLRRVQTTSGNETIFHMGQDRDRANKIKYCYPHLLVPIKTKDEFVMTDEHFEKMKDYLSKCTDMLIIGWKGQEEYFLKTLEEQCSEKEIKATFVTCGDRKPQVELEKRLSKLSSKQILTKYYDEQNGKGLMHEAGTFSSYILNITKKGEKSFFDIESE